MEMSDKSPEKPSWQTELFPTASSADSPARTSARPAKAQDWLASEAAYGVSSPVSLARYDHPSSSWRTWQLCLVEGLEQFSETWPRSGMMRNGIAYQLPPLAPLTGEIVSGYWPTPTVFYTRADWEPERIAARQAEVKAETLAKGKHHTGNGFGLNLAQAVRMWPTPNASDHKGATTPESVKKWEKRGHNLPEAVQLASVKMWPTPNAGDWKAGMSNAPGRQQSSLPRSVGIVEGVSSGRRGGLNPTWVEWLMGFPLGWSAFEDSETP